MQRTKTIPIVFAISVDPEGNGLVESLARPGGNVTGMTNQLRELGPKRLQLLEEVFPRMAHLGVLYEPNESPALIRRRLSRRQPGRWACARR